MILGLLKLVFFVAEDGFVIILYAVKPTLSFFFLGLQLGLQEDNFRFFAVQFVFQRILGLLYCKLFCCIGALFACSCRTVIMRSFSATILDAAAAACAVSC